MKKPNRKTLINKLDLLFSEVVRSIGECEKCGAKNNLQCCHINSRRFHHTRWNQLNALCLCAGCHFWSHQHPRAFGKFVDEYYGDGTMDEIDQLSNSIEPITIEELQDIYEELRIVVTTSR
jgi:hypothetical protein